VWPANGGKGKNVFWSSKGKEEKRRGMSLPSSNGPPREIREKKKERGRGRICREKEKNRLPFFPFPNERPSAKERKRRRRTPLLPL